jgi:8-oxo-dGTP pyrophosphatase MutT (NUDIX family)
MAIKTLATREIYRNRWMSVREDAIERIDGSAGIYSVVDKPDCALIIPIQDGKVYLIEQYRYPVGARYIEFPQGTLEQEPDATPLDVARRELEEETGLKAGSMELLGDIFIAYGITSQRMFVFLATDLTEGKPHLEPEEQDLVSRPLRVGEFEEMMRAGEIKDAQSMAAWSLYKLRKSHPAPSSS